MTLAQRDYMLIQFVRRLLSLLCSHALMMDPLLTHTSANVRTAAQCKAVLKKVRAMAKHAPTPDEAERVRNAVDALGRGDTRGSAEAIAAGQTDEVRYLIHRMEADIEMAARCARKNVSGMAFPSGEHVPAGL